MWGQKISANTTPQSHLMFSLGARNSRAHDTDGTKPAGPQWPWQVEAICHCKRLSQITHFNLLSIKTASKRQPEKFHLEDCSYPTYMDRSQGSAHPSIRYLQIDSEAKKTQPHSWRRQNKVIFSTFPARCCSTKYFLVCKTMCYQIHF